MMKKLLLGVAAGALMAGSASAADLPMRSAPEPYVAVPVFTWTGLYAGLNAGGGLGGDFDWNINGINTPNGTVPVDIRGRNRVGGALIGGTFGYNYQMGSWVLGVEGDIGYTSIGSKSTINLNSIANQPIGLGLTGRTETDSYFGTIRGRLGYAAGQWLLYATGGAAFTEATMGVSLNSISLNNTRALNGYTVGGGVEYALTPAISLKAEYLYASFNKARYTYQIPLVGASVTARGGLDTHLLKLGVNYRFMGL